MNVDEGGVGLQNECCDVEEDGGGLQSDFGCDAEEHNENESRQNDLRCDEAEHDANLQNGFGCDAEDGLRMDEDGRDESESVRENRSCCVPHGYDLLTVSTKPMVSRLNASTKLKALKLRVSKPMVGSLVVSKLMVSRLMVSKLKVSMSLAVLIGLVPAFCSGRTKERWILANSESERVKSNSQIQVLTFSINR